MTDTRIDPEARSARVAAALQRLLPLAHEHLRRMAEDAVDADLAGQPFGPVELRLRDHAHRLAADAHDAALGCEKNGATTVPAGSAPVARATPASSATAHAMS
jgi:hypothetical protein